MAIYLDSAKLDEARWAKELGWVSGVTTNPSLMAKAGRDPQNILKELSALEFHQVYYQLVSSSLEDMQVEARKAHDLVKRGLILKIPPTEHGFRFVAKYGKEMKCCVTAIFDPAQALVAREAGADYIALYVNRATKQLGDGLALVRGAASMLSNSRTEIIAASLKSTKEAVDALLAGARHITVPFDLLKSLTVHRLSEKTVEQFDAEGKGILWK